MNEKELNKICIRIECVDGVLASRVEKSSQYSIKELSLMIAGLEIEKQKLINEINKLRFEVEKKE